MKIFKVLAISISVFIALFLGLAAIGAVTGGPRKKKYAKVN